MSSSSLLQIMVVAGALVGLEACTGLPVKTDINPNMSVANCHTYAFADEHMANSDNGSAFGNPLNSEPC